MEAIADRLCQSQSSVVTFHQPFDTDRRQGSEKFVPVAVLIYRRAAHQGVLSQAIKPALQPILNVVRPSGDYQQIPEPSFVQHAHVIQVHDVFKDVAAGGPQRSAK